MPSSLKPTPEAAVDPVDSGTRHAFLRPLPGEQRGRASPSDARQDDDRPSGPAQLLSRLFSAPPTDDAEHPELSAVGVRIGHFVIEERIGQGGMGAVFRAVDERLNRVVALKVLAPACSRDQSAVERFRNEAQAAARLDHENIARVHYIGEDEGIHFIAFEFIRGTNVRDFILQKGMLTPIDSVNYALQIAQALRHTHGSGVVHRDIKPSNIIITPAGRAKLVDLGLARQEESGRSEDLTMDGTTLGTFDYIAPEQAIDPRQVDVRADIYSLGCTLYHMLTGEPPFPAGTMFKKVVDHHRDAPPDPAGRNPHVSPQLSRIVGRMMASNPDERYATPDHLIQDLTRVAHELGLRPMHTDDVIWVTPLYEPRSEFWERNRGWLVTLGLLLVIALGVNKVPWPTPNDEHSPAGFDSSSDDGNLSPEILADSGEPPPAEDSDRSVAPAAPRSPRGNAISSELSDGVVDRTHRVAIDSSAVGLGPLETLPGAADPFESEKTQRPPGDTVPSMIANEDFRQQLRDVTTQLPGRSADADELSTGPSLENPFVVLDADGQKRFSTLAAACQQAEDGAQIEIQFDGLLGTPQPPIRIQNKSLIIRAKKGARPAIEFVAPTAFGADNMTRMISIDGENSSLQIYDIDIIVPVQSAVTDRWAVFSMAHQQKLQMRGVEVTVRNPQQSQEAAVVEFVTPRTRDSDMVMPDRIEQRLTIVDWKDCVIRGESDVFVHTTLDPIDVRLDNTALAVRGTFARIHGRETFDRTVPQNEFLTFSLSHVTAVLAAGLLDVNTEVGRDFLPVEFACEDSALVVRPGISLMAMAGEDDARAFREQLSWRSAATYYNVDGVALEIDTFVERIEVTFAEFKIDADQLVDGQLLSRTPRWMTENFSTWTRSEFQLRTTPDVPQAADGRPAGIEWTDRVPPLGDMPDALSRPQD